MSNIALRQPPVLTQIAVFQSSVCYKCWMLLCLHSFWAVVWVLWNATLLKWTFGMSKRMMRPSSQFVKTGHLRIGNLPPHAEKWQVATQFWYSGSFRNLESICTSTSTPSQAECFHCRPCMCNMKLNADGPLIGSFPCQHAQILGQWKGLALLFCCFCQA